MAKKDKVHFQYSGDLDAVDSELAEAMEQLDMTNTRVSELLRAYDPPPPETANAAASEPGASQDSSGGPPPHTGQTFEPPTAQDTAP